MVATIAAGTSARYYLAQVEYYLGGREPQGVWLVAGAALGVATGQPVEREAFENLHGARHATGHSLLSNNGNRTAAVGGYDVTFSAPKSVSVLWALANDELRHAIENAQQEAVRSALELIETEATFCRRGRGGAVLERVSLTAAVFQHGEARPAEHADGRTFSDPALHHHAVVINLAQRGDGTFGCLDGRPLHSWKMAAGAVYHQSLAQGLERLGLRAEITGKNGIFEIAGVDTELCRYFSARREEIVSELAELGIESADAPALAAAKARATRASKLEARDQDRHGLWRERAAALGFAPEYVAEQALAASPMESSRVQTCREQLARALAGLTERSSTFERRQLVAAVASALMEVEGEHDLAAVLEDLEQNKNVLALSRDLWGHAIYSTPEIVALEQELHQIAVDLGADKIASPQINVADRLIAAASLNTEQAAAARTACGPTLLGLIEGGPGVGKTTLLRPVAEAWTQAGWTVIGAANAWKIAHQLRDELQIEARALDSWLARAEHGQDFLADRTVLLVDESGLLSSRQFHRLLSVVAAARQSGMQVAVRIVGDRRQLQPIGGPGLKIVADAIGAQRVDTIVRQHEAWARETVMAFGKGEADQALALLDQHGAFAESANAKATIEAVVDAWDKARRKTPNHDRLLIAKTNRQVAMLNQAARECLRQAGQIAAVDTAIVRAVTPSGESYELPLARGDQIRFLTRHDGLGVINGTSAVLTQVGLAQDGAISLTARVDSRLVRFPLSDLQDDQRRVQIAHAYATTCYGSQGLTTEEAFVLIDPAMDRHDIFVAASRARGRTQLFADRSNLDVRAKAARLLNDRKRPVTREDRLGVLATALARSGLKRSTLDYRVSPPTLEQGLGLPAISRPLEGHAPERRRTPDLSR